MMVLTQWFNLGSSVSVVKKLLSISPFVTKVPFVALKLILFNFLCMITWFKLLFSEIPFYKYFFFKYLYMCLVRPFFWVHFHQKRILFKKTRFYVGETWLQGVSSNFNIVLCTVYKRVHTLVFSTVHIVVCTAVYYIVFSTMYTIVLVTICREQVRSFFSGN